MRSAAWRRSSPRAATPTSTAVALAKVREDKEREVAQGYDGTWVAHPDLVPVALEVFDRVLGERPNQLEVLREDIVPDAAALLDVASTPGEITDDGLRNDVSVALQYIHAWLRGSGAVAIFNLDLVVRAEARASPWGGSSKVLAEKGQRLALDGPAAATVGGAVATGAAGPLRLRYGTPRDLLIGITVVRPDGRVAHSGGKVVKNVAGYDIGKLFAGSLGTLGLITEATFRLHPVAALTAYVTRDYDGTAAAAEAVLAAAASPVQASAAEIERPGPGAPVRVGILLEGTADGVSERAERMTGYSGTAH